MSTVLFEIPLDQLLQDIQENASEGRGFVYLKYTIGEFILEVSGYGFSLEFRVFKISDLFFGVQIDQGCLKLQSSFGTLTLSNSNLLDLLSRGNTTLIISSY